MPQWYVKPTNSVIIDAREDQIFEGKIGANATAAKMLPGRFVIDDTDDGEVKEAGAEADNVLGVLVDKPDQLITTAYAVGDACRIAGPGAKVVITLVSGSAAVAPGDPIVTAADGKGFKLTVGAMGSQGTVYAKALESVDASAGPDKTCMVRLVDGAEPAAAS